MINIQYCNINEETKNHLNKLIDFLYQEVLSSGGDGDALWFVIFYKISDILPLVQEYNSKLKFPWTINFDDGKTILWGYDQEWVVITNDEEAYNHSPSWQQIRIRY